MSPRVFAILAAVLAIGSAMALRPEDAAPPGAAISVHSAPLPLYREEPDRLRAGLLAYRGGLWLTADDKRFGGLSGLQVSPDGRQLTAVSDEGFWFRCRLEYDGGGLLTGVSNARLGPLLGLDAKPLATKTEQDAESLAMLSDGTFLIGFEHHHRLWSYRGELGVAGRPQTFTPPPRLEKAPANGSLESVAGLPGGGVLVIMEEMLDHGELVGWLNRDGQWSPLRFHPLGPRRPSDATPLPSGDVLVLERHYSPIIGLDLAIRRVARQTIVTDALLDPPVIAHFAPPMTVDNFEGIAARAGRDGETLVYIVSDDNYSPLQKTLLMMFALEESPVAP